MVVGLAALSLAVGTAAPASADTYWRELGNINSGQCLSVGAKSTAGGAGIIQWKCYGGKEQLWQRFGQWTDNHGTEWFYLRNQNSGKCLADPASSLNDGVQLIQYGCDNGEEQTWSYDWDPNIPGITYLVNYASLKVAAVGGRSTTMGAPVVQWGIISGAREQEWQPVSPPASG